MHVSYDFVFLFNVGMKNYSINIDNEYINELNNKHQEMRQCIASNFENKQPLKSGEAYNKLFKIGDDIVIRQVDNTKCSEKQIEAKNGTFNSIFVQSLLKECGEDTITTGHLKLNNDEMLYMEKAEGSLWEKFTTCHTSITADDVISKLNGGEMTDDEIQITLLTMILECFTTANFISNRKFRFNMVNVNKCNQDVLTKFLSEDNMKIIARHLCKVFLFQMVDRKPENLLVKKDETGKNLFVEADFDDIKEITCLFANIDQDANYDMNKILWLNHLNVMHDNYNALSKTLSKAGKQGEWNRIFEDTIKEYTITEEKMKNIICDIAIKNKYFGLSTEELIKGINEKLTIWKKMLTTAMQNACLAKFKDAMQNTLAGLQGFNENKIKDIVNKVREEQDQVLSFVNKDNTSADCNLRDYIPNWMKTCCGLCQGG